MIQRTTPPSGTGEAQTDPANGPPASANSEATPPAPSAGTQLTPDFIADLVWGYDQGEKGLFAEFAGKNVAILNQTVVGADPNWGRLRDEMACKYGVDPERLVVIWIHEPNFVDVGEGE